jgi:hypothetical protein
MSLDPNGREAVNQHCTPVIAALADDELAARRLESILADDGMLVERGSLSGDDGASDDRARDPDALVVAFGRGLTERDQQMRRLRKRLPASHLVAVPGH